MGRDAVTGWVERYERAWRNQDVAGLDRLFTEHARYLRSPYDPEPLEGLDAIAGFWADPTPFEMTATVIAADGPNAVVRVLVQYTGDKPQEYRDLWVLKFAPDGRAELFEEWAYWPEKTYTVSDED
ncbi:nuclear transport factor 2 family protein [Cellulomonas sp. URHD0024]|uniref:nuclear transport factor 2 family protein n=1 Tax=Cellulomonas sp. URHD0024 TaxID=1302620 RepID=UPI000428AA01|nr:nuclear transport factor 2 family protein [Cellulomonas sp. URHD0024]